MAYEITPTTTALCNSFVQKYWALVEPVHKIKTQFKKKINELESTLTGFTFSASSAIEQAVIDLQDNAKALIPEDTVDAMREIKSFVDGCSCFYGDDGAQNAVGSILGSALGIYDRMDDYVLNQTLPEFGPGLIANSLNQILNGAGLGLPAGSAISDLLKEADCMTSCMNALCPATVATPEFQLILNDLQGLYDTMSLDDNPASPTYAQVDYDAIYTTAGMTPTDVLKMNTTIGSLWETTASTASGIEDTVTAIKDAFKGGFF